MLKNRYIILIAIESIILLIISLVFKDISAAIKFSLGYFFVYFLPGLPLINRFNSEIPTQLILINFFGLTLIPLFYFLFGFLIMPLSKPIFLIIPLIVFFINLYLNK